MGVKTLLCIMLLMTLAATVTAEDTETKPDPTTAVADSAAWALQPSSGPQGRPLPLAGSWNTHAWGPAYLADLLRNGHHVVLNFTDPSFAAEMALLFPGQAESAARLIAESYRPGLEFAREHRLPIAFPSGNWAQNVVDYQDRRIRLGKETIPLESRANAVVDGKMVEKVADPFGPIEAWQDWGKFWFGNALMQQIQAIYPDPPLIIFIGNNETGELLSAAGDMSSRWNIAKFDRFIAEHGPGPHDKEFQTRAVLEGYAQRYAAMFAAARAAAAPPAWKSHVRFVTYNSLADTAYLGYNKHPQTGAGFSPDKGWTKWRLFDGSMPELYDNDWQLGKRDDVPWSMQTESGNYYSVQNRLFAERPDLWWTTVFWDGAVTSEAWRNIKGTSKPYFYATNGLRWDLARYEGWVQFCLWATRPRLAYEFRAPQEPLDAIRKGTWMALLNSVDRAWTNEALREFWRFGDLVPNTAERPWFDQLPDDAPPWLRELNRWYLLTCDANPPRETWGQYTRLKVFAEALVLGAAPQRRWLIYAHAPGGGVSGVTIQVPGFGGVQLPGVPRSGSFFLLTEADRSLKPLLTGGPEEITVQEITTAQADWLTPRWFKVGEPVSFDADVVLAPGEELTSLVWEFGDGKRQEQPALAEVTHNYEKAGVYLVTVEGRTGEGKSLRDQTTVYIGETPQPSVAYDLPLDDAPAWEGPWAGVGPEGQTLATYRHLPNRGTLPSPILTGGRFVDDPERGRVLELTDAEGGVWLARHKDTVLTGKAGAANRTISLWFKAEDTTTRQVLYASGMEWCGMNLYLYQGSLYAGSWATVDGVAPYQTPIYGYNWKGDWIRVEGIQPGRWYEVTWVLAGGTARVEADKQRLFLNGELVGSAPGAALPVEYVVPRIGRTNMGGDKVSGQQRSLTRFHDQAELDKLPARELNAANKVAVFRGRLDDFRFVNDAVPPERD